MSASAKSKLVPRLVVGTLLFGVLGVAAGYWWVRWYHAPHREVREVVGWLPPDTETVSCVEGPWRLELNEDLKDLSKRPSLADFLEGSAMLIPGMLREGKLLKELQGRRVVLSVEGSRSFTIPIPQSGVMGVMPFEGATILVFEKGLGWTGFALQSALASTAGEVKTIAGSRVASFSETFDQKTWQISIAVPRANVLVVATHRGYLEEVLNRIEGGSTTRRLPDFFEDGLRSLQGARFWAVRRCDAATGGMAKDPQDRGLHFLYDPGRSPIVKLTCFCSSFAAHAIASALGVTPDVPEVKVIAPGQVEISFRDAASDARVINYFLLIYLGHGIRPF